MNLAKFLPPAYSEEEYRNEIEEICRKIVERAAPLSIFLFGSSVTGKRHRGSDIDIAVIYPSGTDLRSARKALHFSPLSANAIDLVIFDEEEFLRKRSLGGICEVIANEGKLIYENNGAPREPISLKPNNFQL